MLILEYYLFSLQIELNKFPGTNIRVKQCHITPIL